ncbi:MAG: UDP-2,4-diacetamido-2,4,6-trideoxy-beta-L-altropyranose hydrolase [Terriglobales bacterium]
MEPNTLVIRADASVAIATGHVMRCLALAQAWQDACGNVVFAMAESTPAIDARLRSEGMEIVRIDAPPNSVEDARNVSSLMLDRQAEWVVVDGYRFDSEYQRNLKNAGLRVLFVDDLGQCQHYFADLVLDQNVHANEGMYANREAYTRLLLGPRYAMLRREFKRWRQWRREIPTIGRNLLITMGGSDPDNLTWRMIEALPKISAPDLDITVVAGGSNPQLAELRRAVTSSGVPIHFVGNTSQMPELMAQSDIAIICGGGTLWELLYMGCPTLSYFRTPPQGQIVAELDAMGAVHNMGPVEDFDPNSLARTAEGMIACKDCRLKMAQLGRNLVNGEGIARVLDSLLPEGLSHAQLCMSPIQPNERDDFLNMAEKHFRELNPIFTPAPDWKNSYFENITKNPGHSLRWIVAGAQRVGFILFGVEEHRFLPRLTGAIYELYIAPEHRRKGIARLCARQVIDELWRSCPSKIQLEVIEGNDGAAELWRSLGFQKVTERFVLTEKNQATE